MTPDNVKLTYTPFNLGSQPYLNQDNDCDEKDNKVRSYFYQHDTVDPKFPLLVCKTRIRECLEMNLFLIHRRLGIYAIKPNPKVDNESPAFSQAYYANLAGKALDPTSVEPIAKDLQAFLKWLVIEKKSYEEVIAAPFPSDSVKEEVKSLPIWQYQNYLYNRVESNSLSYNVADRRLSTVRHFYLWSYKKSVISSLPFSMVYKSIKVPKKNGEYDLFSLPRSATRIHKGVQNWVSNLGIPKTSIQPDATPNQLQPYSPSELACILTTDVSKHRTYGLFLKCAYLGGFRSAEVIKINYSAICDPKEDNFSKFYYIYTKRKGDKNENILISPNLMNMLYQYTLDPSWSTRRLKFESKYGINNPNAPLPLFINSSGERLADTAPSSTIGYMRLEQRNKGKYVIERDYHDLRATFGTYLAMAMISNGESEQRVKSVLLKLFSHESFSTSEEYLDFAKTMLDESEHGAMHHWVKDMYSSVDELLAALPDEAKKEEVE